MQQPPYYPPPGAPIPPKKSGLPLIAIVIIAVFGGICAVGVLSAIAIPAFMRYKNLSKSSEARANLARLCTATNTFAQEHGSLPPSASRTPSEVSHALRVADPVGTWNVPTWLLLGFSVNEPHYYSYEYQSNGQAFVVRAYGDLDGDGVLSTFARVGTLTPGGGAQCGPLQTENELE